MFCNFYEEEQSIYVKKIEEHLDKNNDQSATVLPTLPHFLIRVFSVRMGF